MPATQALAQTTAPSPAAPIQLPPLSIQGDIPVQDTTAGPVQGYRALTSTSATRTQTPVERLPQNVGVIPRSVIDSQSAVTVNDAVRNVSNVQPVDTRVIGNVAQTPVTMRGFGADMWVDGYPGNLFLAGDRLGLVNVERIEVLKGPSALVYGGGAGAPVGGAINIVSKLPIDKPRYEAGVTLGSHLYWNPYVDINQPLNADKTILFRLTAEYTGNTSFIDVLNSHRYSINPTLTLTNRTSTSLTLQGFVSNHRQQAYPGLPVEGTLFGNYRVRRDLYFGDPNIIKSYANIYGVTATFDHRFDETFSMNLKARWSRSELNQHSQSPLSDATFTGGTPLIPPSTFDVNNTEVFSSQQEFSINPSVQAKFDLGPSKNTLLIGGDYSRVTDKGFMNLDTNGNFCFLLGFGCPPALVDLSNPSFTLPYTRPIPGVNEGAAFFNYDNTYITKGLYTQLQSSLYDRLHLQLGLRLASIDITYNEFATGTQVTRITNATKLLPRAGAVVDVFKGFSVYASYAQGMKWVPFSQTFAQPQPEYSRQLEAGIKLNLDDKLTGTLAVFDIERQNVPVRLSAFSAVGTTQRSRGFEADLLYQPNRNLSVLASYGYTDATFVDAGGATVPAGNKLIAVPAHSGRLWVNYGFDGGMLRGFSAGAGIYASSGQYVDAQNLWKTQGYYTVDAKIGYENDHIRAAVTIKNLTNNKYYTPYTWFGGQVAPGEPLTVYGRLSYKM